MSWTHNGAKDDVTERLASSFDSHLEGAKVFAKLTTEGASVELQGTVRRLCQPFTVFNDPYRCRPEDHQSFGYSGMNALLAILTLGVWPTVSIFGVPTDWGTARGELTIYAFDPPSGVELARWSSGVVQELGYAGLYYRGSPLANTLSVAATRVVDAMRTGVSELETRIDSIARWRNRLSIEEGLADSDPAVRARALLAVPNAEKPDGRLLRIVADLAADRDPAVRRNVAATILRVGATTDDALGALDLLSKDRASQVRPTAVNARRFVMLKRLAMRVPGTKLPPLMMQLSDPKARLEAASALQKLGANARPALPALLLALSWAPADALIDAIVAIGYFDDEVEAALKKQASRGSKKAQLALARLAERKKSSVEAPKAVGTEASPSSALRIAPTVAVFTVHGRILKKRRALQLTELLAAHLTNINGYRVVPRDAIRRQLKSAKKSSYRLCYDESCQIEIGKALAAQKIVRTEITKLGRECVATITLFQVRTETAERAAVVPTGCRPSDLGRAMERLARELQKSEPPSAVPNPD